MVLRMPRPPSHAPASWSFKDPATASQLGLRLLITREPGVLQVVRRGSRRPCRFAHRPGVRIAHIGDVDAPEVGRIARGFRKCGERNRASLSL
jgi:hypothetical protein